ncbi:aminotransferase class I/II-fold pyridoxal phosphate-dependent enzyme, partial [Streptomyces sp. NPDC058964]|uniref:aminotransferase class I/II-fold pyridoxal phosphate-dependent enzyme n=1 Tax=Streptomyces sp. NPDC058964 TaxID=3346681 RepID=UPI0036BC65CC
GGGGGGRARAAGGAPRAAGGRGRGGAGRRPNRGERRRAPRHHLTSVLAGAGWAPSVPDGGLTMWVRLPGPLSATDLAARAARRGLAVTPGPYFATDRTTLTRHLRLPFTATPQTLTRAVRVLRECAASEGERGREARG